MTNKELFTKAHEMTREVLKEFPDVNYRTQFAICLRELKKQVVKKNTVQNNNNNEEVKVMEKKILEPKAVTINGFERNIAIKIEGTRMIGLLNKSKFIWDYTKHEIPSVEVKNGGDKIKAARYGRLYILERLKMDNVVLPIKTKETTVNYIHIDNADGVWMNCFENGYIRGEVNGIPFVWNPSTYKNAVAVTTPGFKGSVSQIIDTNRIKARLRKAGYTSYKNLMAAIKKNEGSVDSDSSASNSDAAVADNKAKSVCIYMSRNHRFNYNQDGTLSGYCSHEEFKYNSLVEAYNSEIGGVLLDTTRMYLNCFTAKPTKEKCDVFENSIKQIFNSSEVDTVNYVMTQLEDLPSIGVSIMSSLISKGVNYRRVINKEDIICVIHEHIDDFRNVSIEDYPAYDPIVHLDILNSILEDLVIKGQKSTPGQLSSAV